MTFVNNRGVIRLGDKTTHGGVVTQVGSATTVESIRIARVGDLVLCPLCKGPHIIVEGDPDCCDDDIPIALHGHKTSCGASLITSLR